MWTKHKILYCFQKTQVVKFRKIKNIPFYDDTKIKKDHEQVSAYPKEEAAHNWFIIGDIGSFGYETDFQDLWGVFKENGTLKSILLGFHDSFIPYSKEKFVTSHYEALLSAYKLIKLSGKSTIVERFKTVSNIQHGAKNEMYFINV